MFPITLPLLNPNEPEALLTTLFVKEGQHVRAGETLCVLETTKTTLEFTSPGAGYICGLCAAQGDMVTAGEVLCWLAEQAGQKPPQKPPQAAEEKTTSASGTPAGMRITQPAYALAAKHGLDLSSLPHTGLITEQTIRDHLSRRKAASEAPIKSGAIVVYGGGGHGKAVIDFIRVLSIYTIVGIVDDGMPAGMQVLDVPVLGGEDRLPGLRAEGVGLAANAVGGISSIAQRIAVFERLAQGGFTCPKLIHPAAFVEASAAIADGVHVFPHVYIGSAARIGYGCLLNTGVIISHDCVLDDYVNLSPGVILAGSVRIGAGSLLGMGVNVNLGVVIGKGVRIGNGAVVKGDVKDGQIVHAGAVYP